MKQDRSLLEQNLIKPTLEIKRKRSVVADIKKHLLEKHSIFEGSIQTWINNPSSLKGIDSRLLYLFAEQIFLKSEDKSVDPSEFYTPSEIKTSRQYSGKMYFNEEIKFPIKFKKALEVDRDSWVVMIDIKTIVNLLKSRKLHWNPESQREATYKVVNGEIVEQATFYMHNIYDMVQLLKENKLEKTQLTLNCSIGTSNDDVEVSYNDNTGELLIHDGTKIDIVDGAHRIKAAELALAENPDIDFKFEVRLLNFTVPRAAEYLAQISKGERMSETKRRSMSKETNADIIVKDLMDKSVLKDRISKKEMLTKSKKELVTYNTIVNAIQDNFEIDKKVDMYETTDYLIEFFEALLGYYENEFTVEYAKYKKESILSDNNMFSGFIILASKMKQDKIEARHVKKYIENINFNRDNEIWRSLDILDEKGNLTKNAKTNIEKYFKDMKINNEECILK